MRIEVRRVTITAGLASLTIETAIEVIVDVQLVRLVLFGCLLVYLIKRPERGGYSVWRRVRGRRGGHAQEIVAVRWLLNRSGGRIVAVRAVDVGVAAASHHEIGVQFIIQNERFGGDIGALQVVRR